MLTTTLHPDTFGNVFTYNGSLRVFSEALHDPYYGAMAAGFSDSAEPEFGNNRAIIEFRATSRSWTDRATLKLANVNECCDIHETFNFALYGYVGDGQVTTSDYQRTATLISRLSADGQVPFEVDVTGFFNDAISREADFVGFRIEAVDSTSWAIFGNETSHMAIEIVDSVHVDSAAGDANSDNQFDEGDLITVFQAGKYDTGEMADWSQGDWTLDNRFDSSDLLAAFQAGTFRRGIIAPDMTFDSPSATLMILGTDGLDQASVSYQGDQFFRATINTAGREQTRVLPITPHSKVIFDARKDNDRFSNFTRVSSRAVGGAGDDVLVGGPGDDEFEGGAGNDVIRDTEGGNDIYRYQGNSLGIDQIHEASYRPTDHDTLDFNQLASAVVSPTWGRATSDDVLIDIAPVFESTLFGPAQFGPMEHVIGSPYGDRLFGSSKDEVLQGMGGDDELQSGPGNDVLDGGDGKDMLKGGTGDDEYVGGQGDDTLVDESGSDTYRFPGTQLGFDTLAEASYRPDDRDTLDFRAHGAAVVAVAAVHADSTEVHLNIVPVFELSPISPFPSLPASAFEEIFGTDFDDQLLGFTKGVTLYGLGGADNLVGAAGNDVLFGGPGDDELAGGAGDDFLSGEAGRDVLTSGTGYDYLNGGDDLDVVNDGADLPVYRTAGYYQSPSFSLTGTINDWWEQAQGTDPRDWGDGLVNKLENVDANLGSIRETGKELSDLAKSVIPQVASSVFEERSNQREVREQISSGGWFPIYGEPINEFDYLTLGAAAVAAAVTADTSLFLEYFRDLIDRNYDKMAEAVPDVIQFTKQYLIDVLIESVKNGGSSIRLGDFGLKAGIATYHRYAKIGELTTDLPNWHEPYLAVRFYRPGTNEVITGEETIAIRSGLQPSVSRGISLIALANPTDTLMEVSFRWSGNHRVDRFGLAPGETKILGTIGQGYRPYIGVRSIWSDGPIGGSAEAIGSVDVRKVLRIDAGFDHRNNYLLHFSSLDMQSFQLHELAATNPGLFVRGNGIAWDRYTYDVNEIF